MASTAFEPHSCIHCQKIVLRRRSDSQAATFYFDMDILFELSLIDIWKSAAQQCHFIRSIIGQCFLVFDPSSSERPNSLHEVLLCAKIEEISPHEPDGIEEFGLWSKRYEELVKPIFIRQTSIFTASSMSFWDNQLAFLLYSLSLKSSFIDYIKDDPASEEVLTRPVNSKPSSSSSFQLARNWKEGMQKSRVLIPFSGSTQRITDCLANHPECRPRQPSTLPSRVIEISKNGAFWHIQLVCNQKGQHKPYAALSYCWGPSQVNSLRTMKGNIDSMVTSIPWNLLPRTMKDAIVTTHELGIRYLWIEALSIIQDDDEDKAREISQMPHIYGQATVVIAATRAAEVNEGFLHDRVVTHHEAFRFPYLCANGAIGSVTLFDPGDQYRYDRQPLNMRAWALQERLLAPRVLEYSRYQTLWICRRKNMGCTDGWTPHELQTHGWIQPLDSHLYASKPLTPLARKDMTVSLLRSWAGLINHYTRRDLTIHSDGILAVSGIAEIYAKTLDDRYLAGLWGSSLPLALLWSVDERLPRPIEYQGPSWSWVSVNGIISTSKPEPCSEKGIHPKIDNTHIQLVNTDAPFGSVTCGALTVNGRMINAEWRADSPSSNADSTRDTSLRMLVQDGTYRLLAFRVLPDAFEPDFWNGQWLPVTLLLVSKSVFLYRYKGLVLRPIDGDEYSRLGIFRSLVSEDLAWLDEETEEGYDQRLEWTSTVFDNCEPQTITII